MPRCRHRNLSSLIMCVANQESILAHPHERAVVVDEKAADYILSSTALRGTFVAAAQSCCTLLVRLLFAWTSVAHIVSPVVLLSASHKACRIRKDQKAQLVKALREYRAKTVRLKSCTRRSPPQEFKRHR